MHRIAVVAVGLAACGGAPASIEHKVPPTPFDGELPALYADLFVDGKTWTFAADMTIDNAPVPATPMPASVTCTVRRAHVIRHGRAAELDCVPNHITLSVAPTATFVGTEAGLWLGDDLLLAMPPVAFRREHRNVAVEATDYAGGWCVSKSWSGDESRGWTLCLRAHDGVFGGSGFEGTTQTYFGKAPRD